MEPIRVLVGMSQNCHETVCKVTFFEKWAEKRKKSPVMYCRVENKKNPPIWRAMYKPQ